MKSADPHEATRFAQELFTPLPRRYDRLGWVLSFGQDRRWRRAAVDKVVSAGPRLVADVATGPAGVALQIAERTGAYVVGIDATMAMLDRARSNIDGRGGSPGVELVGGLGEALPFFDQAFDALTFSYLLRYVPDPQATLLELGRVVRPGGVMASLEFLVPSRRFWWFWWWIYTRLVLPFAGLLTGGRPWCRVGRFLGPSISGHYRRYPVTWTIEAWERAGFTDVGVRRMSLGGGLVMWGRRADG